MTKDFEEAAQRKSELAHIIHSKLQMYQQTVSKMELLNTNIFCLPHEKIPRLSSDLNDIIMLYSEYNEAQEVLDISITKKG